MGLLLLYIVWTRLWISAVSTEVYQRVSLQQSEPLARPSSVAKASLNESKSSSPPINPSFLPHLGHVLLQLQSPLLSHPRADPTPLRPSRFCPPPQPPSRLPSRSQRNVSSLARPFLLPSLLLLLCLSQLSSPSLNFGFFPQHQHHLLRFLRRLQTHPSQHAQPFHFLSSLL